MPDESPTALSFVTQHRLQHPRPSLFPTLMPEPEALTTSFQRCHRRNLAQSLSPGSVRFVCRNCSSWLLGTLLTAVAVCIHRLEECEVSPKQDEVPTSGLETGVFRVLCMRTKRTFQCHAYRSPEWLRCPGPPSDTPIQTARIPQVM